jgi:predicted phosphate transport protein (TIGR00153 family)
MKLLPREEKFFEYFQQQVKLICRAADLLVEGAESGNTHLANAAHQIKAAEEQADTIIHEIYNRLNSTFITPLDPEDIHSLASALDDIIDGIEDCSYRMLEYKIDPLPKNVLELCRIIQSCGHTLTKAFTALSKSQPLMDYCVEINRLEESADQLGRGAVRALFETETDAIRIVKLKEIYDYLELTADRCEDVADALQSIHVKNS